MIRRVKLGETVLSKQRTVFVLLILATLLSPLVGWAKERITVEVSGLSCPFCAFGLEKKLKQLPGVEKVTIKVNEGVAEIDVAEGKKMTEEQVEQAVKEASFTPGKVKIEEDEGGAP
ncbi:heavy-metal-associated domain-containing protein [Candidatus Manganitrophus noduliformans]|uniref:Heavy-metal-associated domain-containing protein n=1 Tax=Candidatus Manganitrophus noduliformans TaxID=2606439 RepID=A0A7X6IAC5_9BACT|nr:heavy-metal-associated domain-containing protein [Candidatus Manganitrophus noduliformans]NKE70239.1 heavy-metal-associated domain-containing protein [Candidatus Manganitrophus noduliformans]